MNSTTFLTDIYNFIKSFPEFQDIRLSLTLEELLKEVYDEVLYLEKEGRKISEKINKDLDLNILDTDFFIDSMFEYITSIERWRNIRLSNTLINLLLEVYDEVLHLTTENIKPKKRAPSAFIIFSQEKRQQIKDENPTATFGEIGKILGKSWKNLSLQEKMAYQKRSEEMEANL
jgi:hypothetical protein